MVDSALKQHRLLLSQDTCDELRHIVERFVKRGWITVQESSELLGSLVELVEWVKILMPIQACRDPKDDKFLELAINGAADYLVTGDQDLLALHPFATTNIVSAKAFTQILLSYRN
jgi:uncharacterized protein